MLVFGHTGITLGVALLLTAAMNKSPRVKAEEGQATELSHQPVKTITPPGQLPKSKTPRVASLANHADIRLLLIGSLLPDLIDKPVGMVFFANFLGSGRIFCHTLLFLCLISLTGLYMLRRRGNTALLVLSFGTFTHLILDQMWLQPKTLLWPLYGFAFEKVDLAFWVQGTVHRLFTDAFVYSSELAGIAILAWFVWLLLSRKSVYSFVRHGQIR